MSQFWDFNSQNKLRIPLTTYAAGVIDSDCLSFTRKKATLINAIILNYYREADCSIGQRLSEYREELHKSFPKKPNDKENDDIIEKIVNKKRDKLKEKYAGRQPADVSWQIPLNNDVTELLTDDPNSNEEEYYGTRPGHYVRALIEEYARLPYYKREEIVFRKYFDAINVAISMQYTIKISNTEGLHFCVKPYRIVTDPLSMYHYLVGYTVISPSHRADEDSEKDKAGVIAVRISRLTSAEVQHHHPGELERNELREIEKALDQKGVQFVRGDAARITVWLSDNGISLYNTRLHLRPVGTVSDEDKHLYTFECTETQILFYFKSFGKDAKILSPESLQAQMKEFYEEACKEYKKKN